MKTIGIVGGIGPESTIEYYRLLIRLYRERKQDNRYPRILINSIDMTAMLDFVAAGESEELTANLVREIEALEKAGADFALMASNTPHLVFDAVRDRSPLPLISIVEAACDEAKSQGMKKVGLFGTRFTMQGGFYGAVFEKAGIELVTPKPADQDFIHDKYMNELIFRTILDETRKRFVEIAESMKKESGIQGLILGGTELPLILKDGDAPGLPLLDTTVIHVKAALEEML